MRTLIAGNWKMNMLRLGAASLLERLVEFENLMDEGRGDLLICPPSVLLQMVGEKINRTKLLLGAQDCHMADEGAHTGDISAKMLADFGCRYVIVGHSERRADHYESDIIVKQKANAAHRHGLTAIICVGETLKQRNVGETLAVVSRQISGSIPEEANSSNIVIAYEPVWAIGTGRTPKIDQIWEVHDHIRSILAKHATDSENVRLIYGGSMNPSNAKEILAITNVNGGLVGGASLTADEFWAICKICLV